MVLQWVKAWYHMPFTSTINKSHNVFEENKQKHVLTGADFGSRYKMRLLLFQKEYIKKSGVFKYPILFQCDNKPESKCEKCKQNQKCKHKAFVEAFDEELKKTVA